MIGTRISSGSSFEKLASYSRLAIVPDAHGAWIYVSGTTGFDYASMSMAPDLEKQAHQCFHNIQTALQKAQASLDDVVQIRVYLAKRQDFATIAPIVGQYMRNAMPANTTVVCEMVDASMQIEIDCVVRKQVV